jgi:predicted AAA+ superfamily ATPase
MQVMAIEYVPRLVDPLVASILGDFPALLVVGPRATGKTTTAARHARTVIQLDQPGRATSVRADPDAVLRGLDEPVLIDEWQLAPEVLGAIKRAVDSDPRPGRYLITGSVRATLNTDSWPLTGRAIRVRMCSLVERELAGDPNQPTVVDLLAAGDISNLTTPRNPPDLRDYVELAVRSGFPEAVRQTTGSGQRRWLNSYIDELLTRDAEEIEPGRDPDRLRQYLQAWAMNTAGITEHSTLYEAAGISRSTAQAYDRLLGNLLVTETVPAWSSSRIKRLTRMPKRLVADPGLACAVLGVDAEGVLADGDLLGRIVETFVLAQLRAELPLSDLNPRFHHVRTEKGRQEVDLVIEYGAGRLIGVEIKAKSAPVAHDARHLRWLQEELGDKFVCGVVFHTGPAIYPLADRITAVPICALWGSAAREAARKEVEA